MRKPTALPALSSDVEARCKLQAILEQRAARRRRAERIGDIVIALLMFAALSSPMWLPAIVPNFNR